VLDACHPGVVLRAVLAVATVLAVGALYVADSAATWLQTWALATGAALPATLAWLLLVCSLQRWLRTCLPALQYALWVALGALAGLLACALLLLARLHDSPPWLAASASAALLAGALVAALVWRARALAPAAATARLAELQARIRTSTRRDAAGRPERLVSPRPERARCAQHPGRRSGPGTALPGD
jgi:two-component system sensor histidine kinase AlgZ